MNWLAVLPFLGLAAAGLALWADKRGRNANRPEWAAGVEGCPCCEQNTCEDGDVNSPVCLICGHALYENEAGK